MNIQGVNLLSLLSGSEKVGNLQQGLSAVTGDEAGFGSALMQQLGLLQSSLGSDAAGPDLAGIQSWMEEAAAGGDLQQGLQSFAALFGKDLPVANKANSQIDLPLVNKANSEIDLEDTLQTLAGVLQQLQQLETDSQAPTTASLVEVVDSEADTTQSLQAESDQAAAMLNPMPIVVPQAEIAEQLSDSVDASGLLVDAKKPTAVLSQESQAQTAKIDATITNPDDTGLEFDRSISAMMARDNANSKSQQDKAALDLQSETALSQLDEVADNGETNKSSPSSITADISRMNNVLRSETAATVPANQSTLVKHFADPGWRQELGDKLIWMHKQSMPSVELRLNPEHLGPILVKIDMSQDQATVAFTAQNLAVKEAIEAAIPKLREMLGGQQLNLVEVNVSQQQSDQKQQARDFFQMASEQGQRQRAEVDPLSTGTGNEAQNIVDEIEAGRAIATNGLLSLFA